ncbi:MAG: DUF721 domain-containing protein [Balneolaceae bacterium]
MAGTNKPQSLDQLLKQYMKRMPQRSEMKRGMVLHFWPEIVGNRVARATKDLYFDNDRLICVVQSEAWRHELHMNRYSIMKQLNGKVGEGVVKEIVVRS